MLGHARRVPRQCQSGSDDARQSAGRRRRGNVNRAAAQLVQYARFGLVRHVAVHEQRIDHKPALAGQSFSITRWLYACNSIANRQQQLTASATE